MISLLTTWLILIGDAKKRREQRVRRGGLKLWGAYEDVHVLGISIDVGEVREEILRQS